MKSNIEHSFKFKDPSKPWRSFEEQKEILESRGLINTEQLLHDLRHYNYYRLSGYWHVFREKGSSPNIKADEFKPDTSYRIVHDLVVFDEKLRRIVFALIADFEIKLRTAIANFMGKRDKFCHETPKNLGLNTPKQYEEYGMFLKKVRERVQNSHEVFIQHHKKAYKGQIPIWVLVEILQFGELVRLLSFAKQRDKKMIAEYFGIGDHEFFSSSVLSLNTLRNICAHHGRLWNRVLGNMPKNSKNIIPDLAHLPFSGRGKNWCPPDRLFFILSILIFILDNINRTEKVRDLIFLINTLPKADEIKVTSMGFPKQWEALSPWDKFIS